MTTSTKSLVLLAATLVVGFALGLFADASLVRRRREGIGDLRRPPGFVEHMERAIAPHSDAQRDSLRPILEQAAQRNNLVVRDADQRIRTSLDSMRVALSPMLDADQRAKLAAEIAHMPPPFAPGGRGGRGSRGGRGRGGRPGDFPPPGGGPPDSRGAESR